MQGISVFLIFLLLFGSLIGLGYLFSHDQGTAEELRAAQAEVQKWKDSHHDLRADSHCGGSSGRVA